MAYDIKFDWTRAQSRLFKLAKPEDHQFLPNFKIPSPRTQLLGTILRQFPMQPSWTQIHPSLVTTDRLRRLPQTLGEMLLIDPAFERHVLGTAIDADKFKRWLARWLQERADAERAALHQIAMEARDMALAFAKQKARATHQTARLAKARIAELDDRELFLEARTKAVADRELYYVARAETRDDTALYLASRREALEDSERYRVARAESREDGERYLVARAESRADFELSRADRVEAHRRAELDHTVGEQARREGELFREARLEARADLALYRVSRAEAREDLQLARAAASDAAETLERYRKIRLASRHGLEVVRAATAAATDELERYRMARAEGRDDLEHDRVERALTAAAHEKDRASVEARSELRAPRIEARRDGDVYRGVGTEARDALERGLAARAKDGEPEASARGEARRLDDAIRTRSDLERRDPTATAKAHILRQALGGADEAAAAQLAWSKGDLDATAVQLADRRQAAVERRREDLDRILARSSAVDVARLAVGWAPGLPAPTPAEPAAESAPEDGARPPRDGVEPAESPSLTETAGRRAYARAPRTGRG